jgi:putative hemolysin
MMPFVEILVVLLLIGLNGLLAMSELAVVSARPSRLKFFADEGVRGAGQALALANAPGRFLSTVQIGITLVGILSGAYSGSTLGIRLANWLASIGLPPQLADLGGIGLVVAIITYGSLVIGELVPKQLALRNPEAIAIRIAPAMTLLARMAAPLVWLLDISGRLVLTLLGQTGRPEPRVTDEEIRSLMAEAESSGVIETDERRMIVRLMRLADRTAKAVMTPRTDVEWLNLHAGEAEWRRQLIETNHARLPVGDGSIDLIVGVTETREMLVALLSKDRFDLRRHIRQAPIIPDRADALDVLATLREAEVPMALVHDEYGHFEGLVTPADILEAIVGTFRSDIEPEEEQAVVQRPDGSWLLAGSLSADELPDLLGIPVPEERDYATLAGLLLSHLHHLPETGETIDIHGWRFEVIDLDGRRIDKVLASRLPATHRSLMT